MGDGDVKLLYGTTNPGKLSSMKRRMSAIDVEIVGLDELNIEKVSVEETGNSPLENAEIKAKAYYDKYKLPVMSQDSGLYIEGLEEERQPGVYVRRANKGRELSDKEMLEYYIEIARKLGGTAKAWYQVAICLVMDENNVYRFDREVMPSDKFIITDKPYPQMTPGFPLDSISIDIESGKYFIELDDDSDEEFLAEGYIKSIQSALMDYRKRRNK